MINNGMKTFALPRNQLPCEIFCLKNSVAGGVCHIELYYLQYPKSSTEKAKEKAQTFHIFSSISRYLQSMHHQIIIDKYIVKSINKDLKVRLVMGRIGSP